MVRSLLRSTFQVFILFLSYPTPSKEGSCICALLGPSCWFWLCGEGKYLAYYVILLCQKFLSLKLGCCVLTPCGSFFMLFTVQISNACAWILGIKFHFLLQSIHLRCFI